jgi:hypothetical protein
VLVELLAVVRSNKNHRAIPASSFTDQIHANRQVLVLVGSEQVFVQAADRLDNLAVEGVTTYLDEVNLVQSRIRVVCIEYIQARENTFDAVCSGKGRNNGLATYRADCAGSSKCPTSRER